MSFHSSEQVASTPVNTVLDTTSFEDRAAAVTEAVSHTGFLQDELSVLRSYSEDQDRYQKYLEVPLTMPDGHVITANLTGHLYSGLDGGPQARAGRIAEIEAELAQRNSTYESKVIAEEAVTQALLTATDVQELQAAIDAPFVFPTFDTAYRVTASNQILAAAACYDIRTDSRGNPQFTERYCKSLVEGVCQVVAADPDAEADIQDVTNACAAHIRAILDEASSTPTAFRGVDFFSHDELVLMSRVKRENRETDGVSVTAGYLRRIAKDLDAFSSLLQADLDTIYAASNEHETVRQANTKKLHVIEAATAREHAIRQQAAAVQASLLDGSLDPNAVALLCQAVFGDSKAVTPATAELSDQPTVRHSLPILSLVRAVAETPLVKTEASLAAPDALDSTPETDGSLSLKDATKPYAVGLTLEQIDQGHTVTIPAGLQSEIQTYLKGIADIAGITRCFLSVKEIKETVRDIATSRRDSQQKLDELQSMHGNSTGLTDDQITLREANEIGSQFILEMKEALRAYFSGQPISVRDSTDGRRVLAVALRDRRVVENLRKQQKHLRLVYGIDTPKPTVSPNVALHF